MSVHDPGSCSICGIGVEHIRRIWDIGYCDAHYEKRMEELTNGRPGPDR